MFSDGVSRWPGRRRIANKFAINILAKIWVRSKRLKELKTSYLQRSLPLPHKKPRPLRDQEIRVLHIKPGYAMSSIECDFAHVDLKAPSEYSALSYTWGTFDPTIPILLNGKVSLISENLYLALLHLRKRGVTTLWVDALCIMQDDLAERSQQVAQMKDVYKKASMVFVWLGESNELSERAFDKLHNLAEHLDWDGVVPKRHFGGNPMEPQHEKWEAISEILYRPWFRRIWIIQEVLSAPHVLMVCGKDILFFEVFLRIVYSMVQSRALKSIMSYHPNRNELSDGRMRTTIEQLEFLVTRNFEILNPFALHEFKATLLDYLAATRWAEATDPRDKVYGILSLASDNQKLGYRYAENKNDSTMWHPFKVDYNVSKEKVFMEATKAIISTMNSLDILHFARYDSESADGHPSWVPNWAKKHPHHVFGYVSLKPSHDNRKTTWRSTSSISGRSQESTPIRDEITWRCQPFFSFGETNALKIRGLHIDTIAALSSLGYPQEHEFYCAVDPQNKDQTALLEMLRQHFETVYRWTEESVQLAKECSASLTGQSSWNSFKNLVYRDTPITNPTTEGFESLLIDLRKVLSDLKVATKQNLADQIDPPTPLLEIASGVALTRLEAGLYGLPKVRNSCPSQRFSTTQKGYMGLVPTGAEVGDLVCIIYGCELPIVLREFGHNTFRLIGHSTFQGLDYDDAVVKTSSFQSILLAIATGAAVSNAVVVDLFADTNCQVPAGNRNVWDNSCAPLGGFQSFRVTGSGGSGQQLSAYSRNACAGGVTACVGVGANGACVRATNDNGGSNAMSSSPVCGAV
ncbi:heterokaryon incompatibility protein-domain-containing protein [Phaeosphaeriaceae sp. PMI808]|nr:heterokaryon incompatibility protein-domain-containing protein [Phaeosphaeriaceae sp. PMI808]